MAKRNEKLFPILVSLIPPLFILVLSLLFVKPFAQPQQDPEFVQFIFNSTELPTEDEYDYIIVGGGTSGCPLAATLSTNYEVLLVERGGNMNEYPNLINQEGFLSAITQVDSYDSPAESFTSEEGVPNARGRVLGGSSAINAGFYSRADSDFYGVSGFNWDLDLVNGSYEWIEESIVFTPELRNWQSAFRDGLLQAANITPYNGFNLNHLIGTKIGGTTFDSSGRRHTSADLLIHSNFSNIRVSLRASVERIILNSISSETLIEPTDRPKKSAIGIVYRDQVGRHHHAMIRGKGEVILCAGAIGSPQLLLLSGIGPRPYLSSWGIPVAHHLPYVGESLYDNPRNGISFIPSRPIGQSLIQVVGITDRGTYIEAASNIVPFMSPPHSVFVHGPASSPLYLTVATIMEKIVGPLSAGSLRLASTDVRVQPIIRFNYFSNPEDLKRCVEGMRIVGEILRGASMDVFKTREFFGRREFRYVGSGLPANQSDDGLMEDFCKRTVNTIWHYHGGCVVGEVVDSEFRVIGVDSLRVVDGSTFSISPGTNPQATLMMMGRYVGVKILEERKGRGGDTI
ncbi:(R)-mandelonitrile lyase-like [Papaver somniferum]|uniref:(R)-mandelonitrile lyase-like n=1 Tax=Papaver somniferum TaxID=3469 RepID=UPI000E6F571B|nr:(R)-mandelonitrile lyase-like [Papaver somniferum]